MTVTTLLQGFSSQAAFTSLLLLSSKGENPAQSKSDSIAGKKVFFFFSPPSPRPSLPPPSSPQSRLSVGGEIAVDCTYRGFSRFFFFFEKVWLLSRQITGDQDQVPQSEAALAPPPSRSSGERTLLGESRRILVTWRGRRRGGTSPKRVSKRLQICFFSFLHPIASALPHRKEIAKTKGFLLCDLCR